MSWRLFAIIGVSFAAGYGVATLRKRQRQRSEPVLQNVAQALLSIHRFTDRAEPILVHLANGDSLSVTEAFRLARELGV